MSHLNVKVRHAFRTVLCTQAALATFDHFCLALDVWLSAVSQDDMDELSVCFLGSSFVGQSLFRRFTWRLEGGCARYYGTRQDTVLAVKRVANPGNVWFPEGDMPLRPVEELISSQHRRVWRPTLPQARETSAMTRKPCSRGGQGKRCVD